MSKAVLISIRPKWVEKIANGEKTIEVRKTKPKLETPFKCYIYCTLPKCPHKEKPSLLKRGFSVRKTVRKIEDKMPCVWYFYWRNGKYFYHSKKAEPVEI